MVTAIPTSDYLLSVGNKRRLKPRVFGDSVPKNRVLKYEAKNSRRFKVPESKNAEGPYSQSFFVRTILHWNKLCDQTVSDGPKDSFFNISKMSVSVKSSIIPYPRTTYPRFLKSPNDLMYLSE